MAMCALPAAPAIAAHPAELGTSPSEQGTRAPGMNWALFVIYALCFGGLAEVQSAITAQDEERKLHANICSSA